MYKAVHEHMHDHRVIGFQEVELVPHADGRCDVGLLFQDSERVVVTAHWRRVGDFFLTSAECHPAPE